MKQLTHYNSKFRKREFPVTVVCDNVNSATNIGSIFRMSDAFGIKELILCGKDISLGKKMTKTSRATEKSVLHSIEDSALRVLKTLKNEGHYIIALEITTQSHALHKFQFPANRPLALVLGDENFGISEDILDLADAVVHIDMYGQNSSMNVVQAANICLYEMTRQLV